MGEVARPDHHSPVGNTVALLPDAATGARPSVVLAGIGALPGEASMKQHPVVVNPAR